MSGITCWFIVLMLFQMATKSNTFSIFPLSEIKCKEVLDVLGEDTTDVEIMHYELDAESTILTGQAPNRDLFRFFIVYEKDFEMNNLTILIKEPIMSPMFDFMYKYGVYEREYLLYSQVFTEMRKLDEDTITAKFLFGSDLTHIFAIDDIYMKGYKQVDLRKPFLDMEHCRIVFKYLAKMHALSVVLNEKGLIPEKCKVAGNMLTRTCDEIPSDNKIDFEAEERAQECKNAKKFFSQGLGYFIKSLDEELREKYSDKLQDLQDTITDRVSKENADGFGALIHGNMWSANMVFKYHDNEDGDASDGTGIPEKIVFLNFEGASWGNPVFDILYVAIGSMKFENYEEHFDSLLEMYADTLNGILESHNLDVYKLEDLKVDIHKNYCYAMWVCGVMLPMVNKPESFVDLSPITRDVQGESTTRVEAYDDPEYKAMASKWFRHFVQKGAFED